MSVFTELYRQADPRSGFIVGYQGVLGHKYRVRVYHYRGREGYPDGWGGQISVLREDVGKWEFLERAWDEDSGEVVEALLLKRAGMLLEGQV